MNLIEKYLKTTLVFSVACTTTTSHLASPYALSPKEVEITGAYAWQGNTVLLQKSFAGAEVLAQQALDEERDMSKEEFIALLDTTIVWSLFRPGSSYEIMGRVGVTDKLLEGIEVGLRSDFSTLKTDVLWQLWESKNGRQALALSGAYAWHYSLISSEMKWLSNSQFSRQDFDASLMVGIRENKWLEAYIGPRFLYSSIDVEPNFDSKLLERVPVEFQDWEPSSYFQNESMMYYGATFGGRIGNPSFKLSVEMTALWVDFRPAVLGETRSLSGLLLSPAMAFTVVPSKKESDRRSY